MKNDSDDILYMHMQASERFVLFNGLNFREFAYSLPSALDSILLLKHQFDGGEYNLNVLLESASSETIAKLLKENVRAYGDFCWIDFEEAEGLDELDGSELAELLYLGHTKTHLQPPFFRKLNNQYVYLAQDDGWFNKVYFRSLSTCYLMLGNLIPLKLELLKVERTWFGIRKRKELTAIPLEVISTLVPILAEGVVFSFRDVKYSRAKIEIPIWVVGDYLNMDEMQEDFLERNNEDPDIFVIFSRKEKTWDCVIKNDSYT
ncbi:hypothetical protein GW626_01200 [Peribacillus muralis]|uniref:hypothetical protein n=1 Tax=Peribacillus muralis TaxID=264697 RepID=UPI001F4E06EE|nr:hypothetical protein [Peribacillus muralis]MCK1995512.1 hypothetical protein [Peribacillus muralis]MCK2016096.1 hypothetical protein [Peribacillus muralis]